MYLLLPVLARAQTVGGLFLPEWTVESDSSGANFGWSVAGGADLNGDGYDDFAGGAPWVEGGYRATGVAMAFYGSTETVTPAPAWKMASQDSLDGPQVNALGVSLATGDLDGDGYADLVVGSIDEDDYDEGAITVYHGSAGGLATTPTSHIQINPWCSYCTRTEFGTAVATGDVNGDGYDDLIVGAPAESGTWGVGGSVHLFYGGPGGLADPYGDQGWDSPDDWVSSSQLGARFGQSVAAADVNGDGYADLVIGAPNYNAGEVEEGRAYVYLGDPTGWSASPAWFSDPSPGGSHFGASVARAGDVDGDGYDDVLIGAPNETDAELELGAAYVYLGSNVGLQFEPGWHRLGDQAGARFGAAVSGAGDANGDGLADLVIGAPRASAPTENQGKAFVFLGSPYAIASNPAWAVAPVVQANAGFGAAVAAAGDVNGDGLDDILVATPFFDGGQLNEGQVTLFRSTGEVGPFDADGDGFDPTEDCDDSDPSVYPNAPEICDGKDSDCNRVVPPDELDFDQDGALGCGADCDDGRAEVGPEVVEVCGDGIDNNCDGADEVCPVQTVDTGGSAPPPASQCGCGSGTAPPTINWAMAGVVALALSRRPRRQLYPT